MLVLKTERLRLRWFEPADAAHVLEQLLEPSWIKNIRDPGVHDLAAARVWMEEKLLDSYWTSGLGLWAVERASDGQLLGMCGLLQRDYLPAPDIGYAFLPRFWGQGYAREAAAACLSYAQEVLGQSRLYASTAPANEASQKVLQSIGFRYQEDLALDGNEGQSRLFIWGGKQGERSDESQIKDMLQRFYRAFNNREGRVPNIPSLPFWLMGRAAINLWTPRPDAAHQAPRGGARSLGAAHHLLDRSDKGLVRIDLREFMKQRAELLGPDGDWQGFEESVSTKRLELHGRVAHVWLRYHASGLNKGQAFAFEGVKSIQLIKLGEGWKIAALAWEDGAGLP